MSADGRLERAQEEVQAAKQRWDELRQNRRERERALRKTRSRLEDVRREAKAKALLPDSDAEHLTEVSERVSALEQSIAHLEDEEVEAKEAWAEAKARKQEVVREKLPIQAEEAAEAKRQVVACLERLGSEVAERYVLEVLPAREEEREAAEDLSGLVSQLKAEGDDRRTLNRQKRELRGWVEDETRDVSPAAILGFLVVEVVRWSRRASSPVEPLWEEKEVPELRGSVFHEAPIPALQDTLAKLRNQQVPI